MSVEAGAATLREGTAVGRLPRSVAAKEAAIRESSTYSVELTKTPMGLGLSLTKDVVTEIKPDSQAAQP